MEVSQALAIAAAALFVGMAMDQPAFPRHISARTEAAIETAVENAVWRTHVQPAVLHDAYAPEAMDWDSCEAAPKAVRL